MSFWEWLDNIVWGGFGAWDQDDDNIVWGD